MATSQEIYRDLSDNGKLDGRYTRAEIERTFALPRVVGPDARLPRKPIAIQATPSNGPDASTPATSMPEFWLALLLLTILVWWCVDHFIIKARRKR